jgi:hypothetical protein
MFALAAIRLRVVLLGTCAVVASALFIRGWTRVSDRPWFAILATVTLTLGVIGIRAIGRRFHTLSILTEAGVLRARGIGHHTDYPLHDVQSLRLVERTVRGFSLVAIGNSFHSVRASGKRAELVIGTSDESLLVEAPFRYKRNRLCAFAAALGEATDVQVSDERRESGRLTSTSRLYERSRSLNPDSGSRSGAHMIAFVMWVLALVVVLFAVPLALMTPPYENRIGNAAQIEERFHSELTATGTVTDGMLTLRARTECLRPAERDKAEPIVTDAMGRFAAWLTATA